MSNQSRKHGFLEDRALSQNRGKTTRTSWQDIKTELNRRISEGEWKPGARISGEAELAEEFACSRSTVNRALQDMAKGGLVVRKRRAGTHVALHPVREARMVIPLVRQEIEDLGRAYGYQLLNRERMKAPMDVATKLGLPVATTLLHVRCLHLADGVPYQYEDRWINREVVAHLAEESFVERSPNEWLVHNAPFTEAAFHFFAVPAKEAAAEALQTPLGAPLFVAERFTRLGDKPITLVRLYHPPGHHMVLDL